jgi:acyl CoA:acetate/3-ketoacid CoA transferase alpha subunit
MNKLVSLGEAAALVETGATLALGGMTLYRRPTAFVFELLRRSEPPHDFTLLNFTSSYESDLLVGAGLVRRVRTCYFGFEAFGLAPMFTQAANLGEIEIVEETEASLAFGLKATLADVGFMPGRGWIGTDMLRLRPDVKTIDDPYTGEEVVAFPALRPTVAVIHALQADRQGNARLNRNLGVDSELAMAAAQVVVTAEAIVDRLDTADLVAPLVTAVAHAPRGAWPTSCHPLYPVDGAEVLNYLDACGREAFDDYLHTRLAQGVTTP